MNDYIGILIIKIIKIFINKSFVMWNYISRNRIWSKEWTNWKDMRNEKYEIL